MLAKEWTPKKVPVWRLQACIKKHGQYVGIAISNNYFACLTWFVAIAFRLFGADVKNLWFAPTVISLLKIRLKLGSILHYLGNKWKNVTSFLSASLAC